MNYTPEQLAEYRALAETFSPLPEGCIFVPGGVVDESCPSIVCWAAGLHGTTEWVQNKLNLRRKEVAYAVPAESDIARKYGISLHEPPDWSEAPEWAMWWAQNKDGRRGWCEKKPEAGINGRWVSPDTYDFTGKGEPNPAWFLALEARPKPKFHGRPEDCAFRPRVEIEEYKDGSLHDVDYQAIYYRLCGDVEFVCEGLSDGRSAEWASGYLERAADRGDV